MEPLPNCSNCVKNCIQYNAQCFSRQFARFAKSLSKKLLFIYKIRVGLDNISRVHFTAYVAAEPRCRTSIISIP